MKQIIVTLLFLQLQLCFSQKINVEIPSGKTIEVATPANKNYEVSIKNYGYSSITIKVVDKNTNEFLSGFGLEKKAKEKIRVENSSKLTIQNDSQEPINLKVTFKEIELKKIPESLQKTYISFTLKNKTASSIPLIIPNVMNPNLSPFSESGVTLTIGQKIYFKEKGKKYFLLKVDDSIEENSKIDVSQLIKNRKKELKLY